MPGPNKNKTAGFTLLEIIVSITLLALIALMISRVFNESAKAVDRGSDDVALDGTARLLLSAFEQDISQALIRTNVAFRIYPDTRDGTLYFISTAARKQHNDIPRDMAPMRISSLTSGTNSVWNRYLEVETVSDASDSTASSIGNLIHHSDYYISNRTESVSDFGLAAGATFPVKYTQAINQQLQDHSVLTFIDVTVNGNPNWNNNNPAGLPELADLPRFVDVSIGLISAKEMNRAIQRNSERHIENNERIYTRRIYMQNQGTGNLAY